MRPPGDSPPPAEDAAKCRKRWEKQARRIASDMKCTDTLEPQDDPTIVTLPPNSAMFSSDPAQNGMLMNDPEIVAYRSFGGERRMRENANQRLPGLNGDDEGIPSVDKRGAFKITGRTDEWMSMYIENIIWCVASPWCASRGF